MNRNKIILNDSLKIGSGSERDCYRHPSESKLCIKIKHINRPHKMPQNEADFDYYGFLEKKNISWSNLARCYGWVETNMGPGLVFDLVTDSQGEPCKSLQSLVDSGIPLSKFKRQIELLYGYLLDNNVIPAELQLDNILYKPDLGGECCLVIVDGLGNRNFFSWAVNSISLLAKLRIRKKYRRFLFKLKRAGIPL